MWQKIKRWVRFVLQLEPVAVQGIVRGVLVVAAALVGVFGLQLDTAALEGRLVTLIAAVWALSELVGAVWARRRSTPTVNVVEAVPRPVSTSAVPVPVIAGPANERVETGAYVRYIEPSH